MRGRTINRSAMILDEAQNASSIQMKMFLTRLGIESRAIITGDESQIDLPSKSSSGLIDVLKILKNINDIGIVKLNEHDNFYFYLLCGQNDENDAQKIINQVGKKNCMSLSTKDVSEIIYYIYCSDIFIGNDSFGHHVSSCFRYPPWTYFMCLVLKRLPNGGHWEVIWWTF